MHPFDYQRATDTDLSAGSGNRDTALILAGGTTLIDIMKLDVLRPRQLVDIHPLKERFSAISAAGDGLSLGALASMAEVADHPDVRRNYPVVAQSLALAASPQLRNMATLGGNVLQRTRCPYFRDVSYPNCSKRDPGSGCAAMNGFNRMHAVLGTSDACIATYPGDFAQALIALDAEMTISGAHGERKLPFAGLHRLPGATPDIETSLGPGDLITAFRIPRAWPRSLYLKIRDRQSYEFALASAAVALDMRNGEIADARIALGGVAAVPWRARDAEAALKGRPPDGAAFAEAAEAAFAGAQGREHNGFKIELGRRTVMRALREAAAMEV
jgi:xanthine dehydrogenase YagS FAD-binding subunit